MQKVERQLIAGDDSYLNISSNRFKEWQAAYPDVDIDEEIKKANSWLSRNKGKRWKTLRGFESWLHRAQENAPRRREDVKSRGQLSHVEQVQREHERIQKEYDKVPRASEEQVGELLRLLRQSLPAVVELKPERSDWRKCDHAWSRAH